MEVPRLAIARFVRAALLVLSLSLAACSSESDPALVGRWGLAGHAEIQETFAADGHWSYRSPVAGSDVAGTWDADEGRLQICGSFCSSYQFSVDGTELTTIDAEGTRPAGCGSEPPGRAHHRGQRPRHLRRAAVAEREAVLHARQ